MMAWSALQQTMREIRRNKMRSSLTTLGILIGVAAVIAMIALGRGATAAVQNQLSGMGQNLLFVVPGAERHGPGGASSAAPFDPSDADAIRRQVVGLAGVAPIQSRTGVAVYGATSWRTSITASTTDYLHVLRWKIGGGRGFSEAELRTGAPVCLLAQTVRHELFGSVDPLGATVRVGNVSLRVVGTLTPKGTSTFGMDQDDFILIPLATGQRRFSGTRDVDIIFLSATDPTTSPRIKADVEALMRSRRHLHPDETADFVVRDMKEIASTVGSITGVLTSLLAAIAAVSLLVGGIGIMNIMLVAVSERTREIGIRLAIGARGRDVLTQFLIEAIALSTLGGIAGITFGLSLSYLATSKLGLPLEIDATLLLLPFSFAAAVGVIFGFFPARKAAKMNPIDALRRE